MTARPAFQAGLVALLVGSAVQWWAHRADLVLAFWDAQAHLDIARRVWDSTTPGIQMLGTVWLPVPHLLYLPFTLVDSWWWGGLAGGVVGLAAFIAIAMASFAIVQRHTEGTVWAWVAALAVILNPSLAYLQTTAMTEPILLAFLTGSVWAIDRWRTPPHSTSGTLWVAGLLAALAVGSRYDGWFFAAIAAVTILWRARRLAPAVQFSAPVAIMVLAWLGYNAFFFGDPLEFQRGIWSAESQQTALAQANLLPTKGAPLLATWYYAGTVGLTIGIIAGGLGTLLLLPALGSAPRQILLLLWCALPFNILALVAGQSVIGLPWTEPSWFLNVRYGVMLLPAVAITIAIGTAACGKRWGLRPRSLILPIGLLIGIEWGWTVVDPTARVGTLREAVGVRDQENGRQMNASRWLAANYDRGRILVAPAVNVSPRTRIPLRDRVYPWTWEIGPAALAAPSMHVDWVLVDRRAANDPVARAIGAIPDFAREFDRVFTEQELEIWRRR